MPEPVVRSVVREISYLLKGMVKTLLFLYLPVTAVLTAIHFPYDTDPSLRRGRQPQPSQAAPPSEPGGRSSSKFYEAAYERGPKIRRSADYERLALEAAGAAGMEAQIRKFVSDYQLQDKKVLDVGSGRGYLQDMVKDYTGLDLSPTVAPRYHKPFVAASATKMPFADNSFDAICSVWVLEHIPEPERALLEMRRVLKPNGVLFIHPNWNCPPWLADGFEVRPYSDFNWRGKVVKASLVVRGWPYFALLYLAPTRAIRWAQYAARGQEEPLRFHALEPNYETYWQPDSDAAISIDSYEPYLWFRAHGDACLNCGTPFGDLLEWRNPMIFRISK